MHAHEPVPHETKETIDLWVSDFLDRPAAKDVAAAVGEEASAVLAAFLEGACHGGKAPPDLEPEDVSHAFLDHVSALDLPDATKRALPALVAAFLADLEDQGRLSGGRGMGARVRASADEFARRAAGRGPDLTRQAPKIGRNDPCPCGSGKKYKRCHGGA
jgi:hypothetical protein